MSAGHNQKFIKQKAKYLETHFVIVDDSNFYNGKPKGIYEFDLKPDESVRMTNSAGKRVKVVHLRAMARRGMNAPGRNTNAIVGYYLPYAKNHGFHHRLVEDVDFCFTDTMNGCTFCVGSGDTPLVSHYNFVNDATQKIDQAKIDLKIASRYKSPTTALRKDDYKTGAGMDQRVTMIGIRDDGRWSFYYQRRDTDLVFVPGKGSSLVEIALDQSVRLT